MDCSSSPYEVEMTWGMDFCSRSQFTQVRYGSLVFSGVEGLGMKGGLYNGVKFGPFEKGEEMVE